MCWLGLFKPTNFWNFKIISNKKIVYIKVVDLDQTYNFVVHKIFIWGRLVMIFAFQISNFKFQNFKRTSDEKMSYTKVVDLDQIYNIVVEKVFIWGFLTYKFAF